jgi:hypothetical protein
MILFKFYDHSRVQISSVQDQTVLFWRLGPKVKISDNFSTHYQQTWYRNNCPINPKRARQIRLSSRFVSHFLGQAYLH